MKALKIICPIVIILAAAILCDALLARLFFLTLKGEAWLSTLGGKLLLSVIPAAIALLVSFIAELIVKKNLTVFAPLALFVAALIPWLSPLFGTNDTFLWYYQAIFSFGALGWSLIFCAAEFLIAALRQRYKSKQSKGEASPNTTKGEM